MLKGDFVLKIGATPALASRYQVNYLELPEMIWYFCPVWYTRVTSSKIMVSLLIELVHGHHQVRLKDLPNYNVEFRHVYLRPFSN